MGFGEGLFVGAGEGVLVGVGVGVGLGVGVGDSVGAGMGVGSGFTEPFDHVRSFCQLLDPLGTLPVDLSSCGAPTTAEATSPYEILFSSSPFCLFKIIMSPSSLSQPDVPE